jgi:glycosyltransferase involved in cell wall biosynthesis
LIFKEALDLVMDKTRVILISSVRPEPTSAGQIILYRHLVDQPKIILDVCGNEPKRVSPSMLLRRVLGRVAKWGGVFDVVVNCLWVLWKGRWIDRELPKSIDPDVRTVVMTVAHGEGFYSAHRFAKRHQLPLVVFFHDWWPDMVELPKFFRRILEKHFLSLAKNCSFGLCVSEGMRKTLGAGMNLKVLPPIPAKRHHTEIPQLQKSSLASFRILYSGNLGDYGHMLCDALEESLKHPEILLQVRGSNPKWRSEFKNRMQANGRWLDFSPRAELEDWLATADAFLIPMVFEHAMRRRMEASFPSKLIEFTQFGKPLIIWGPEYCAAIRWGRNGNKALCVTDPNPQVLIKSIIALKSSLSEQSRLSSASMEAAKGEFDPDKIQDEFLKMMSVG